MPGLRGVDVQPLPYRSLVNYTQVPCLQVFALVALYNALHKGDFRF